MPSEVILLFRLLGATGFALTVLATFYVIGNQERIFGINPEIPSERPSSRLYAKFLVFAALAHALVLFGSFALLLH